MKKLISIKDIEECKKENKNTIYIENNTIITPAARDMAENLLISFVEKKEDDLIEEDKIYKLFSILTEKGMLEEFLNILKKPFQEKKHSSGLKIIPGNTIKFKSIRKNIEEQEIMNIIKNSVGVLQICTGETLINVENEEINYIIEGSLDIVIENDKYSVKSGDIVYLPVGKNIRYKVKEKTKIFYVKCIK